MKLPSLLLLPLLLIVSSNAAAQSRASGIKPPQLQNRTDILAEKHRLAQRVLKRGDSLYIRVFTYIDRHGVPRMPEIKTPSGNAQADSAALRLVRKMVFSAGANNQKGVLMTIPVVFVRK